MADKLTVLVDTNVIIEAVRTGCWNALRGHYRLVTVNKCAEEARSGIARSPGYVSVEDHHLSSGIEILPVTDRDRARLVTACEAAATLDDGERDLWAHARLRSDDWRAVSADQAAVRIAFQLGWGDHMVSLEELIDAGGIRPEEKLKRHYTRRTLSIWRTTMWMDDSS